jgi:hypothetical protein
MVKSGLPMGSESLSLRPSLPSQIPVAEQVQQTLALMLGLVPGERIPLRCSPSGIMYTASPRLTDVLHWTAAGANEPRQGDNIMATEVICESHPDNTGRIWVRTRIAAASNNAFPLDKGDVIGFSVENLSELRALIVTAGDTLIVGYSL